jgi:hypothetical protein
MLGGRARPFLDRDVIARVDEWATSLFSAALFSAALGS